MAATGFLSPRLGEDARGVGWQGISVRMSQLIRHPGASGPFGLPAESLTAGAPVEEKTFSVRHYLEILLRRKWLVLLTPIVVAALVAINVTTITPLFRSSVTIQIDPELRLVPYQDVTRYSSLQNYEVLNTELTKLSNPDLVERVVEKLDLASNPAFAQPIRRGFFVDLLGDSKQRLKRLLGRFTGASAVPRREGPSVRSIVVRVQEHLSTSMVRSTNLIRVSFDSTDRATAAQVANAVAEIFVEEQMTAKYQSLDKASGYLENQLEALRQQLEDSVQAVADYGRSKDLLADDAADPFFSRLNDLSGAVSRAEEELVGKEATLEAARSATFETLPPELKDESYRGLESKYNELRQRRAGLLGRYGPAWPEVQDLNREIEQLEGQMTAEMERALERGRQQVALARRRLAKLQAEAREQREAASERFSESLEMNLLKGETALNQQLYQDLLTRLKQSLVAEGLSNVNIRIVQEAQPPSSQYYPNKTRALTLALLFGLALGVALAFGREFADTTLKSEEDMTQFLNLPSMGVVPHLGNKKKRRGLRLRIGGEAPAQEPYLIEWTSGSADKAGMEAYRSLRTSLMLSNPDKPPQTILVTSALAGEGKSTTAVNIASSLAQLGRRTLILELDLRKPCLAELLGTESAAGVSGYLSGNSNLTTEIQESYLSNLFLVSAGAVPPNPPELLASQKLTTGLTLVKDYFDHIVIDSPPVLEVSDALLVGRQTDGVLLVARARRSPRLAVLKAASLFQGVKSKVLGVLINDAEISVRGYGSYNYYGYPSESSYSPESATS